MNPHDMRKLFEMVENLDQVVADQEKRLQNIERLLIKEDDE